MTSRERTLLALEHQEPDRVPVDFWMSAGFSAKLRSAEGVSAEAFLDAHDVDLRYIEGPAYVGPPLRTFPDRSAADLWGVRRKTVRVQVGGGAEHYKEVVRSPLQEARTLEEINAYQGWPSADWFDYRPVEAQCDAVRERGRVAVFMGDRLNRLAQLKPAMYLRGTEQILADVALRPRIAHAVFDHIRSFCCAYGERVLEAGRGKIDILLTGDDFGSQHGPLISPSMWVEFLGEGFAQYVALGKAHGARVMHHTCGSVRPIVPLMIERGLDILQSLQPEAAGMNARALKAEFGDLLAFHGGISIQNTLPRGTPEQVRAEVRDRVEALAGGGGYILCTSHNIQADTPLENLEALMQAYREFGAYS